MDIAIKGYEDLFGKIPKYKFSINYSGRFTPYNAKVMMKGVDISFSLSRSWENVDDTIQMGLIEYLLAKLFKSSKKTDAMNLYNTFIKSLDKYDVGISSDPLLLESFNRMNDRFFDGLLDMPHLEFGVESVRKLGSYNFHTNTIVISSIFRNFPDLLDAVMYHEMLHKYLKYDEGDKRHRYHTTKFRRLEKKYNKEKEISEFLRKKSWKKKFLF